MKENFELAEAVGVIGEAVESGGRFAFYPRGTSMLPTIRPERDMVSLVKVQILRAGDIILYKRKNGQFVLHRIVKISASGELTLCGDNQRAFEKNVAREDVLFLAESYERNGKTVKRGSLLYAAHWKYARVRGLAMAVKRRVFSAFCRKSG